MNNYQNENIFYIILIDLIITKILIQEIRNHIQISLDIIKIFILGQKVNFEEEKNIPNQVP